MVTQLRVYRGPEESEVEQMETPDPAVRVRLGDLLPLVALAQRYNFTWLKDFLDDEVTITEDLHEVLQSFRGSRPRAS
jgi:hypothetical protein